jgi:hypothetical protein
MNKPDFRALCAELTEKLHELTSLCEGHESELTPRAFTALAQPELVVPTDEELIEPIVWMIDEHVYDTDKGEIAESVRELIARWGTPANNALCSELCHWVIELAASHPNLSDSAITWINEVTDRAAAAVGGLEGE